MSETGIEKINAAFANVMIAGIKLYRKTLSPYIGKYCRYRPTCSVYTQEAISIYGPWRGGWMGVKRICRCNPFGGFGFDPVPPRDNKASLTCETVKENTNSHE